MRVLLAIHGFPPTYWGGAENAAVRIANWLIKNGHSVEVFTIERLDDPHVRIETSQQDRIVVHRLFFDIKAPQKHFKNTYDHPHIGAALKRLLKNKSFDIVHLVSGYLLGSQVISVIRQFKLPIVVTLTEYWFMCARLNLLQADQKLCVGPESHEKCVRCVISDKRRYRLLSHYVPTLIDTFWSLANYTSFVDLKTKEVAERHQILKTALAEVDLVICPSQFILSKFEEFNYDTRNFVVIQHGVDKPQSSLTPPTISVGTSKELRLGYMGQINSHKGVDLIVQAVAGLLDAGEKVRLDIWGNTNSSMNYVAKLLRQSIKYPAICWNGGYDSTRLGEVLAGFDVLVVPSRWYENSPTVIYEAYTAGKPVVATNLGGMAELVKHEKSGLMFELNDVNDLQKQLKRLIHEPDLLPRLQTGIPVVKTADEEVEEIFNSWQEVISRKRKP